MRNLKGKFNLIGKQKNSDKIDLGCADKCPEGYIGIDISKSSGADIIHNCEKGLKFIRSDSLSEVRAWDFLEHIHPDRIVFLMNEIWRVLRPGGLLRFKVPDTEKGQGAFQDVTHKTFFVRNSFLYYSNSYYRKLYGIKANFRILNLDSIEYEIPVFGKLYAITGTLEAIKNYKTDMLKCYLDEGFKITTDDLCLSNLKYFKYWDKVKEKYPELKLIAFTIANYQYKENLKWSREFKKWYEKHKDWVEIHPHGYDHTSPQEGFRDDQKKLIKKSLRILKKYLPEQVLYRPPGFKYLNWTEGAVRELGFAGIAYQDKIKYFNGKEYPVFNTHLTIKNFDKPIGRIWKQL